MLNHCTGGTIHFGINDDGKVEEGLNLRQEHVIDLVKRTVGEVLVQCFWKPVDISFVDVLPVNLFNDEYELTGRWRFDIIIKPHPTIVQFTRKDSAYYRQGPCNKMSYEQLVSNVRAERDTSSASAASRGAVATQKNPPV